MKNYLGSFRQFLVKRDYSRLLLLLSLAVLTGFVELAGVGSIFPYINLLSHPEIVSTNHYLKAIGGYLHLTSIYSFEIFIGAAIFAVVVFKGVLSCINNYMQTKFSSRLSVRIAKRCLNNFLHYPFNKYINADASALAKNVLIDVECVTQAIAALLSVATDIVIASSLVMLMLWVDVKLILLITVLLVVIFYLTIKATRQTVKTIGIENERYNRYLYKTVFGSLHALKDVKVYAAEKYFLDEYVQTKRKTASNLVRYNVYSSVPSVMMSIMSFGIVLVILLYLLISHGDLLAVLPTAGVIALSVQRLLPSATRMSVAFGLIMQYRVNVYIVKNILKMKTDEQSKNQIVAFNQSIKFEKVRFRYEDSATDALREINLEISKNKSLGIVGESGAGKSTLVDVLLGLLPIKSGNIFCDGVKINGLKSLALQNLVGYVPQQTNLIDATISKNIAFGIPETEINDEKINAAIQIAQLGELVQSLPDGLGTMIGDKGVKLSGGQRQRIGIARALYHDPEIIVMDEATNSLDSATETAFNEALKLLAGKKTLIVIAHRYTSVKFCDQLIVIDGGKIASQGTHEELSVSSELYKKLYVTNMDQAEAVV